MSGENKIKSYDDSHPTSGNDFKTGPSSVEEVDNSENIFGSIEEEDTYEGIETETGEINWDCPCLGKITQPPCGEAFKEAFSCFFYSKSEPKGSECFDLFKKLRECFDKYPEIYSTDNDGEEVDQNDNSQHQKVTENN